jgi:TetR/AcrR family transcriptional regulator, transcriptional repressor for nem operon
MSAKGEKTRTEIVKAAKDLFYRKGYHHTSFSDIVEDAGVLRGNIYHYFKSKDELLAAIVEQRLAEYAAMLESWDSEYVEPVQKLKRFARMLVERRDDLAQYGCPVGTLNAELGKTRQDAANPARALMDLFATWLTRQFVALEYRKEARAVALHLLGRAQGISVISHVYKDADLLQREVAELEAWIDRNAKAR